MNVSEKKSSEGHTVSVEALLLQQHKMLLVKQLVAHVTGRLMFFGLLVYLALTNGSPSASSRVTLLIVPLAATVISYFWHSLGKEAQEQAGWLEEVIVHGNDTERELAGKTSTSPPALPEKADGEVDRWKQIYIQWQHERWKHSGKESVLRSEPLVWWWLVVVFAAARFIAM